MLRQRLRALRMYCGRFDRVDVFMSNAPQSYIMEITMELAPSQQTCFLPTLHDLISDNVDEDSC